MNSSVRSGAVSRGSAPTARCRSVFLRVGRAERIAEFLDFPVPASGSLDFYLRSTSGAVGAAPPPGRPGWTPRSGRSRWSGDCSAAVR